MEQEWSYLVEEYRAMLYRIAFSNMKNRADAIYDDGWINKMIKKIKTAFMSTQNQTSVIPMRL